MKFEQGDLIDYLATPASYGIKFLITKTRYLTIESKTISNMNEHTNYYILITTIFRGVCEE